MNYVYFIQPADELKPVKIGLTRNLTRRLEELQVGNPYKLKVKLSIKFESSKEAERIEKLLHNQAEQDHLRLSGEWFLITKPFKTLIESAERYLETIASSEKADRSDRKAEMEGR